MAESSPSRIRLAADTIGDHSFPESQLGSITIPVVFGISEIQT